MDHGVSPNLPNVEERELLRHPTACLIYRSTRLSLRQPAPLSAAPKQPGETNIILYTLTIATQSLFANKNADQMA